MNFLFLMILKLKKRKWGSGSEAISIRFLHHVAYCFSNCLCFFGFWRFIVISVKETTKNAEYPNHIYILSDDKTKLYACLPLGKKDWFKYDPPLRFDPRGRTFKPIG